MKQASPQSPAKTPAAKLTLEQIEEKRLEVSHALGGSKVHALCYEENEEHGQVLVFLKEPNLQIKIRSLDSIGAGNGADNLVGTGSKLLEALIIKEYSDPRVLSGHTDFDTYYIAAATEAIGLCKAATNIIKKKQTKSTTTS
jgi:hypothetical protein